jgi:hypothetical protein
MLVAILFSILLMIKFIPILFLISSCSIESDKTKITQVDTAKVIESLKPKIISDSTNTLTGKTENLELEYIVWGCACANWVTPTDFAKYENNKLAEHCIFIEPTNGDLDLPLYFAPGRHRIKVPGQFYLKPDYPKGTAQGEEQLDKAKVFSYTRIEVINNPNFKPVNKIEILTLNYNVISCTCAQWSEPKYDNDPDKKVYYWLEPSSDKLIKADTLFNGLDLPVQIKVTGQIVSENGFPKRNLTKVGQDEAGKVFRYTKIEVLKNGQKKSGF